MKRLTTVRQIDVARTAGVSQRAVSAVVGKAGSLQARVSVATAERIRKVADQLGYRPYVPAQQMKGKRSGIIGVLIGAAEVEVNYRRLSILERLARENNYRLMVGYLHDQRHLDEYVNDFQSRGIEGVLCLRHELSPAAPETIPHRLQSIEHVVFLDPPAGLKEPCYVRLDRAAGIEQAMAHLKSRGRRRIGLVLDDQGIGYPMRERLRGYRQALAAAGEPFEPELVWTSPDSLHLASPQIGRIVDELILGQRVDAVLASNDAVAAGLLKGLRKCGRRVPDDVAIVGYDNISIGSFVSPELTTIDHQNEQIAALMLDMLMALIEGRALTPAQRERTVKPAFVIRESA